MLGGHGAFPSRNTARPGSSDWHFSFLISISWCSFWLGQQEGDADECGQWRAVSSGHPCPLLADTNTGSPSSPVLQPYLACMARLMGRSLQGFSSLQSRLVEFQEATAKDWDACWHHQVSRVVLCPTQALWFWWIRINLEELEVPSGSLVVRFGTFKNEIPLEMHTYDPLEAFFLKSSRRFGSLWDNSSPGRNSFHFNRKYKDW